MNTSVSSGPAGWVSELSEPKRRTPKKDKEKSYYRKVGGRSREGRR